MQTKDAGAHYLDRKIRETLKAYLDEPHLVDYIGKFKDGLWPGGQLKPPSPPRTAEEKLRTRDEANRKLSALMPGTSSPIQLYRTILTPI